MVREARDPDIHIL